MYFTLFCGNIYLYIYIFIHIHVRASAWMFILSLPRRSFFERDLLCATRINPRESSERRERCYRCSPRKEPPFPPIFNFISTATISPRPPFRPLIAVDRSRSFIAAILRRAINVHTYIRIVICAISLVPRVEKVTMSFA